MKKISAILLIILSAACTQKVTLEQIPLLNGYWEIEKVTFPDGQTKDYTVNESIDFIKIDATKGFRKKVNPTFNGTYNTNDDAEFFTIISQNDMVLMVYKTEISEWTETLTHISENNFSVTNQDQIEYSYKRYEPINISK